MANVQAEVRVERWDAKEKILPAFTFHSASSGFTQNYIEMKMKDGPVTSENWAIIYFQRYLIYA